MIYACHAQRVLATAQPILFVEHFFVGFWVLLGNIHPGEEFCSNQILPIFEVFGWNFSQYNIRDPKYEKWRTSDRNEKMFSRPKSARQELDLISCLLSFQTSWRHKNGKVGLVEANSHLKWRSVFSLRPRLDFVIKWSWEAGLQCSAVPGLIYSSQAAAELYWIKTDRIATKLTEKHHQHHQSQL